MSSSACHLVCVLHTSKPHSDPHTCDNPSGQCHSSEVFYSPSSLYQVCSCLQQLNQPTNQILNSSLDAATWLHSDQICHCGKNSIHWKDLLSVSGAFRMWQCAAQKTKKKKKKRKLLGGVKWTKLWESWPHVGVTNHTSGWLDRLVSTIVVWPCWHLGQGFKNTVWCLKQKCVSRRCASWGGGALPMNGEGLSEGLVAPDPRAG